MALGRLTIPSNDKRGARVIELRSSFLNQEVTVTPVPPALGDPVTVPPGTTTGPTQEEADDAAHDQGGNGIPPLFGNEAQTATCPAGRTGAPVTVPAGTYTDDTLAGANALALAAATAGLSCAYLNTAQTAVCGAGRTGTPVTVAAGTFSASTQAAANALALAAAQAALVCAYLNSAQTAVCPVNKVGTAVTVAAGTYSASTQAVADALALAAAQAGLSCMFLNETQTYVANCPNGFTGTPVTVTKAPSATYAAATLAAANANALAAATAEAQAQLTCVPVVIPHPPVITSALTGNATQGTAFSYQITGTNSPNKFGATNLPSGLTIDTNTGLITGTPTVSGVKSISISASNNDGKDTQTYVLTIAAQSLPPVITSALTKTATQHVAMSYQIVATHNPTSYDATNLPAGLLINKGTGVISGTPTGSGNTNVGISATNADGTDNKTLVVQVAANPLVPVITSSGTATGQQGVVFSYQIVATLAPTSYDAANLPAGLSINKGTGVISGTPTGSGNVAVTLSATNGDGTGNRPLALTINPPAPVITSALSSTGQQDTGFSYQIVATNSPTSYAASGLPSGISIDTTTGLISGIPTGSGNFTVSMSATNGGGTGSATLSLAIAAAPPPPPPPPDPVPAGGRFALTHTQLDLGQFNFGVRALSELQVEAQELKTANLVPIIYADDFDQAGFATLYDLWLTALESIGWKMVPGFRGYQSPAWRQWIIDRKDRAGFFRNSEGQVVLSGFFTAWDLDQGNDWRAKPSLGHLQSLRDAGMNPAYYPDPPFSGTQSNAFRAQAIGAKGTAVFFPAATGPFGKGTNTMAEYMGVVASEKAACDNYGIQFMQPIMPAGFVAAPSANFRMLSVYGWDDVFVQFQFARANGLPCIQLITWTDFVEHTYLKKFRNGETVVGTPSAPFVSGMLILDHSGIAKYSRRHVQWFLTGTEPAIAQDEVIVMTRLHPRTAKSYDDMTDTEKASLSAWFPPESTTMGNSGITSPQELSRDFKRIGTHEVMDDAVGVCTWLTVPTRVDITVGSNKSTHNCPAGETRLIVPGNAIDQSLGGPKHRFTPDQFGLIRVEMFRNNVKFFDGQTPVSIQKDIIPGAYNLWSAAVINTL